MTRAFLLRRREVVKADLLLKFEAADYHGVADAAMDLREIEAMLSLMPETVMDHAATVNEYYDSQWTGKRG